MDQITIILIAAAVAALVWAAAYLTTSLAGDPKRRLQQRLAAEGQRRNEATAARTMRLIETNGALNDRLAAMPRLQVMQQRLSQAFPGLALSRFLIIDAIVCVIAGAGTYVLSGAAPAAITAAVLGAYLPIFIVSFRRARWKRAVTAQLPEALDFLGRVLRAGQSFSTGLQMMSEELAQPLAGEFRRCYDQHGLGQPIEEGLRDMAIRLESQDFAFFVTAVVIQRQSGGDLAEVLQNISKMVRQRLRLQQSVKAKTAEGRLTGYVMVAFPAVMFVLTSILNPERASILLHSRQGHMLIGTAFGLQTFGFLLIRRITTIRV